VSVYVVSDTLQPTAAELHVRVLDFQGKTLLEKTQAITVPELSSKVYATFSRQELLTGTDAQHAFAVFDLMKSGKVVSRDLLLFDRTRNLALPVPAIQADWSGSAGTYTLRLQSPVLARHVYASFGDNEVEVSDNYFDLLPGEAVTLQLKSKADVDQLRRSLKVRNITDAFPRDSANQAER
jgi:beta-mannosidase